MEIISTGCLDYHLDISTDASYSFRISDFKTDDLSSLRFYLDRPVPINKIICDGKEIFKAGYSLLNSVHLLKNGLIQSFLFLNFEKKSFCFSRYCGTWRLANNVFIYSISPYEKNFGGMVNRTETINFNGNLLVVCYIEQSVANRFIPVNFGNKQPLLIRGLNQYTKLLFLRQGYEDWAFVGTAFSKYDLEFALEFKFYKEDNLQRLLYFKFTGSKWTWISGRDFMTYLKKLKLSENPIKLLDKSRLNCAMDFVSGEMFTIDEVYDLCRKLSDGTVSQETFTLN